MTKRRSMVRQAQHISSDPCKSHTQSPTRQLLTYYQAERILRATSREANDNRHARGERRLLQPVLHRHRMDLRKLFKN